MKEILKHTPYYVIIGFMVFLFFDKCSNRVEGNNTDTIKSDTVYVTKVIPSETIKTVQKEFTPIYIKGDNTVLLNRLSELENKDKQIIFLLEKLQTRVYDSTYVYDKGSVKVKSTVEGSLLERDLEVTFNEVEFEEKVITNTIKKYPNFEIMLGVQSGATLQTNEVISSPYLGVYGGIKNKRGYELGASFNTERQLEISLKKSIFTKYNKN